MNNDKPAGCTEATVFGPFYVEGAPGVRAGRRRGQRRGGRALRRQRARARAGRRAWSAECRDRSCAQADEGGVLRRAASGARPCREPRPPAHRARRLAAFPAACWPWPTRSRRSTARWATCWAPPAPSVRPAHLHFMIRRRATSACIAHVFREGDTVARFRCGVRGAPVAGGALDEAGQRPLAARFRLRAEPLRQRRRDPHRRRGTPS